jgi:hypothetical protein
MSKCFNIFHNIFYFELFAEDHQGGVPETGRSGRRLRVAVHLHAAGNNLLRNHAHCRQGDQIGRITPLNFLLLVFEHYIIGQKLGQNGRKVYQSATKRTDIAL